MLNIGRKIYEDHFTFQRLILARQFELHLSCLLAIMLTLQRKYFINAC
jgi:hypothetical protein